jgi:hypothetical protein
MNEGNTDKIQAKPARLEVTAAQTVSEHIQLDLLEFILSHFDYQKMRHYMSLRVIVQGGGCQALYEQ